MRPFGGVRHEVSVEQSALHEDLVAQGAVVLLALGGMRKSLVFDEQHVGWLDLTAQATPVGHLVAHAVRRLMCNKTR